LAGVLREIAIAKPLRAAAVAVSGGMLARMKKVKVYTLIGATGEEKVTTLNPLNWDVRILSYKRATPKEPPEYYNGEHIVTVGVEDLPNRIRADDWKDVIIVMRKWAPPGEEIRLLIQVFYLWHYPGNRCMVWYEDKLIYDSDVDGWRKPWILVPWE